MHAAPSNDPCDRVVPEHGIPWPESIDRYCHQASSPRLRAPANPDTSGPGRFRPQRPSLAPSMLGRHFGFRPGVDPVECPANVGGDAYPCRSSRKLPSWSTPYRRYPGSRPRSVYARRDSLFPAQDAGDFFCQKHQSSGFSQRFVLAFQFLENLVIPLGRNHLGFLFAPLQPAQHQILPGHQLRHRHALLAHVGNQSVAPKAIRLLNHSLLLGGASNPSFSDTHLTASQRLGRGKERLPAGALFPTIDHGGFDARLLGQNCHRRGARLVQTIKNLISSWMWSAHWILYISPPRFRSSEATYRLRRGDLRSEESLCDFCYAL